MIEARSHRFNETRCLSVEQEAERACKLEVEPTGGASRNLVIEHSYTIGGLQREGQNLPFAGTKVGNKRKGGGTVGRLDCDPVVFLWRRQMHALRPALSQFLNDGRRDLYLVCQFRKHRQELQLIQVLKWGRVADEVRQGGSLRLAPLRRDRRCPHHNRPGGSERQIETRLQAERLRP